MSSYRLSDTFRYFKILLSELIPIIFQELYYSRIPNSIKIPNTRAIISNPSFMCDIVIQIHHSDTKSGSPEITM
jgi:hypothetical protein